MNPSFVYRGWLLIVEIKYVIETNVTLADLEILGEDSHLFGGLIWQLVHTPSDIQMSMNWENLF